MNYHSDKWVMDKVETHLEAANVRGENWVSLMAYGSQNYGLDTQSSDVDTRLIVLPSFEDIVLNKKPVSYTKVLPNDEHIDFKDIRLFIDCLKKQNMAYLECIFTPYKMTSSEYWNEWQELLNEREAIARYNPYKAVKTMKGIAMEKYHAMEHRYPTKTHLIDTYGYDCYHPDTLFLTKRGWLNYDEILDTDELGTMNPETLQLEWQHFTDRISKIPSTNMYEGENYNTHFCITETHNVFTHLIKNRNKVGLKYNPEIENEWKLEPLKEALTSGIDRHIISFPSNNQPDNPKFTDDILKVFGAYISEGSINFRDKEQSTSKAVRITQTNHGKKEFHTMMDNITTIPMKKYEYVREDKNNLIETTWILNKEYADLFLSWSNHGSINKKLPNWIYDLSERQAKILLKAMWLGDGTEHQSRYIYYTSSKALAKDTCALANLAGYTSNILGGENGYESPQPNVSNKWQVQITKRVQNHTPSSMKFSLNRKDSSFKKLDILPSKVVCFTVPNGLLITMYKGKTAVQGNCKQLMHLLRIEQYLGRYIDGVKYADCLQASMGDYLLDVKNYHYNLEAARIVANTAISNITRVADNYCAKTKDEGNKEIEDFMNSVVYKIMKKRVAKELIK